MNTTGLIGAWSMQGARSDLESRFGSALDIHAAVSERDGQPSEPEASPVAAPPPLLVKSADDTDWRPLSSERAA